MRFPELTYDSPNEFSPFQRMSAAVLPRLAAGIFKGLCRTCRSEIQEERHLAETHERFGQVITCGWHESLALGLWFYRNNGMHTLTSYSYDGELAARFAAAFDLHALRGSSSRGGFDALRQLRKAIDLGASIALAIDGPRGPRRVAKPGIAILAAGKGLPVVPTALVAQPAWRTRSWDRMMIPKPGGRIICRYGPPVAPPAEVNSKTIEAFRRDIERGLNTAQERLESILIPR